MIVRTKTEWQLAISKIKASRDPQGVRCFSIDTETVDTGYPDVHITSFSLAWYEEGTNEDGSPKIDGAYVPVGHSTGELQLCRADVYDSLKEICEDSQLEKVAHNFQYDLNILSLFTKEGPLNHPLTLDWLVKRGRPKGEGIYVSENITDTYIQHFLLNTNGVGSPAQVLAGEGKHGLKDLALHLLHHKMTELADLAPKEKYIKNGVEGETLRTDLVPIADVYEDGKLVRKGLGGYAWDDAVQTLKLREIFRVQLLDDPDTRRVYDVIHREFTFVLAEMVRFGIELDIDLLKEMEVQVAEEIKGIKERMYMLRPGQNFDQIADAELVRKCAERYIELDRRFSLPPDNPEHPKKEVTKGKKDAKVTTLEPASKGTVRKQMFVDFGLAGHPVEELIRDEKLCLDVIRYPHLAHKIFKLGSNDQLNTILFDECHLEPMGKKTENGLWSTKGEYIDTWADNGRGHPMAVELYRYREVDKLYGTYLVGMPALLASDGRLRTRYNQTGARTGRLSSSDPNLQNIPISLEFAIRKAFVAFGLLASTVEIHEWHKDDDGNNLRPKHLTVTAIPGNSRGFDGGYELSDGWVVRWWGKNPPWVLFVGDYSQLEICLLAHVSSDAVLIDAVTKGLDIHALTAQFCFDEVPKNISLAEVKKNFGKYRKMAKPIGFGILYGMGPQKLAKDIGITVEEAKKVIEERYMVKYPGVKCYIEAMHAFAVQRGYVQTQVGRRRHLPAAQLTPMKWRPQDGEIYQERRKAHNGLIAQAKRQAQNTPVQGFAADLVGLAMRDMRRYFKKATVRSLLETPDFLEGANGERPSNLGAMWGATMRMLLQVHDEVIQESHPAVANFVRRKSVDLMENGGKIKLRVPLRVDAALGTNWLAAKE